MFPNFINILLFKNNVAKIGDLGLSIKLNGEKSYYSTYRVAGTPGYIAPEIIQNQGNGKVKFREGSDIYSFGIIILQIITGSKSTTDIRERAIKLIPHLDCPAEKGLAVIAIAMTDNTSGLRPSLQAQLRYLEKNLANWETKYSKKHKESNPKTTSKRKRTSTEKNIKMSLSTSHKHHHEKHLQENVLYEDSGVRITEGHVVIRHYFFPTGTGKHIPFHKIKSVGTAAELNVGLMEYKSWGMGFGNIWWARNFTGHSPQMSIVLSTKKGSIRKGFVVEQPDVVLSLIRSKITTEDYVKI